MNRHATIPCWGYNFVVLFDFQRHSDERCTLNYEKANQLYEGTLSSARTQVKAYIRTMEFVLCVEFREDRYGCRQVAGVPPTVLSPLDTDPGIGKRRDPDA
jgi:hypothetical protein